MPYKDLEKQRAAVKEASKKFRVCRKDKLTAYFEIIKEESLKTKKRSHIEISNLKELLRAANNFTLNVITVVSDTEHSNDEKMELLSKIISQIEETEKRRKEK